MVLATAEKTQRKRGRPRKVTPAVLDREIARFESQNPSISRSDELSCYLKSRGLAQEAIETVVRESLEATIIIVEDATGKRRGKPEDWAKLPDWKPRQWAVDFLAKNHGWLHVSLPPKTDVPVNVIQFVTEIQNKQEWPTDMLVKRLKERGKLPNDRLVNRQ